MSADHDPFYVARDEISQGIVRVRGWLQEYKSGGGAKPNLAWDISTELKQLDCDLQDLAATIGIVEKNPKKFRVTQEEIQKRRDFITQSKQQVGSLQEESQAAQQHVQSAPSNARPADDYYARAAEDHQQRLVARQDDQLQELSKVADRLNLTAATINEELHIHENLLKELDDDIDTQTAKMNFVMKRVGVLLKTSNSKQIGLIIVLFAIFVFLLFMLIQ
eukprot:GEMP01031868.1.p1 GENE.GEMP01031868.1~~GEMP01031868.1.p1  ORF type:complete len:220 (+),score=50.10 GEMP01031868.1:281-940(+)